MLHCQAFKTMLEKTIDTMPFEDFQSCFGQVLIVALGTVPTVCFDACVRTCVRVSWRGVCLFVISVCVCACVCFEGRHTLHIRTPAVHFLKKVAIDLITFLQLSLNNRNRKSAIVLTAFLQLSP